MSLEAAIQENTSALRDLIAAIKAGVMTTAAQVAAVVTEAKPVAKKGKADPKPDATQSSEPTPTVSDNSAISSTASNAAAAQEKKTDNPAPEPKAEVPTYASVVSAVKTLAEVKGRNVAIDLLSKFGVTNGRELKPEQYVDVIAACNRALGG